MPEKIILVRRDNNDPNAEGYQEILVYDLVEAGEIVGNAPVGVDFDAYLAVGAADVLRVTNE